MSVATGMHNTRNGFKDSVRFITIANNGSLKTIQKFYKTIRFGVQSLRNTNGR